MERVYLLWWIWFSISSSSLGVSFKVTWREGLRQHHVQRNRSRWRSKLTYDCSHNPATWGTIVQIACYASCFFIFNKLLPPAGHVWQLVGGCCWPVHLIEPRFYFKHTLLAKKVVTPPLKTIKPMWIELFCFHLAEIGMIWTRDYSPTQSDTTLGRHSMQGQVRSSRSETTV